MHWCLRTGLVIGLLLSTLSIRAAAHPGSGIVVDRNGNVYFVVFGSNVIMRLTPDGDAKVFVPDDRLRLPHHLVLTKDGTLYTASDYDGRVWRVGADGSLHEHFNSNRVPRPDPRAPEVHVGSWGDPFTIDSTGNIFALASANASEIIRITPDGRARTVASNARFGGLHFASMAWGRDGALYISDASRVWRITGDSATPIVPRGAHLSQAAGLAIDDSGNVYVADYEARRVVRIAPDGSVNTPRGIERLRLRHPTGVAVAGSDVYVLDSPNGAVAVWRVRSGQSERLYSRMSLPARLRLALPALLLLLVALLVWNSVRRSRARRSDATTVPPRTKFDR